MGKETWARKLGRENLPGPAEYTTRTEPGAESPRFTIKGLYPDNPNKLDPAFSDIPSTVGDAPKFTIRPYTEVKYSNDNPGPEYIPHPIGYDYTQRSNGTLQQRDYYSERRNPRYRSYSHSPFGPAKYDARHNPGDHKDPAYSIGEHCGDSWLTNKNDFPSGAHYMPMDTITRPSSPRWSIHQRLEGLQPPETPGPGAYDIPDTLNRRPNSIHVVHRDFKPYMTPGPGKYNLPDVMGAGSPKTSIHPLCPMKEDNHGVPYIGIPREFDTSKTKSIHGRCNELRGFQTPGPGTYAVPRDRWNTGRSARMSPRGEKGELWGAIYDKWRSPGPAEYKPDLTPTKPSAPAITLHDNVGAEWTGPMNNNPGPGMYGPNPTNPGYKRSPRFSIRPRTGGIDRESPTKDAGYVNLTNIPFAKGARVIHPREELDLIPE